MPHRKKIAGRAFAIIAAGRSSENIVPSERPQAFVRSWFAPFALATETAEPRLLQIHLKYRNRREILRSRRLGRQFLMRVVLSKTIARQFDIF